MPEDGISASSIRILQRKAMRHARTPDEADDLVQDVLLAALEQQRDCGGQAFLAWASGVLRRRALFLARTAGRRRRREAAYSADPPPAPPAERKLPRPFIESLPPSLQTVALLANAGLGRAEIADLLRISDTALRQRISGLRRSWRDAGAAAELMEIPRRSPPLCGIRRRSLKTGLVKLPGGRLAAADPDGHQLFFGGAHVSPGRGNQEDDTNRRATD